MAVCVPGTCRMSAISRSPRPARPAPVAPGTRYALIRTMQRPSLGERVAGEGRGTGRRVQPVDHQEDVVAGGGAIACRMWAVGHGRDRIRLVIRAQPDRLAGAERSGG